MTSVRARRGPPQESPVDAACSHEGLEINDAASSLAVAPSGFANTSTPSTIHASYDRQQAYVSARVESLHKTRILTLLQKRKKKESTRDAIAYGPSARQSSTRDPSQHTRPRSGRTIASLLPQHDF